jgi:ankyrin repeat protein
MRTLYATAGTVVLLATIGAGAAGHAVPLIEAVKTADARTVGTLLQQHVDVNAAEVDGTTALHWAVHRNDAKTVDRLVRAGAKVNVRNAYGMAPLSMAAEVGNAAIVERLLRAGADPNTTLRGGETALMTAARTGSVDTIKALLAHGGNVNVKEETRDQTALMWAAAQGRTVAVRLLIENGADVHARSTELKTFHEDAYLAGRKGAESRERLPMFTPFLFAVRGGHLDTAKVLLDAGADVNEDGPDKTPALHIAIINAHWQLAAMLLERGADAKIESPGGTALHHIARVRAGRFLWKTPTGLPMPEATGTMTAMELAKAVLAHGADPNARITKLFNSSTERAAGRASAGLTPLMMAQIPADPDYVRVLLAGGADPKLTSNNHTNVLMMASGLGMRELLGDDEEAFVNLKMAVDAGLDLSAQNDDGDTALHGAAFRNYIPILQYLVQHGAKLDVKNKIGWTPLMEAHWTGRGLFNTRPEAEAFLRAAYAAQGISQIVTSREEAIEKLYDSKGGPVISCPQAVAVQAAGGPTVINYAPATATTRRRYATLDTICTPPSGSVFPIGTTTVTCTAKDDNGRSDSCSVLMKVLP